MHKFLLGIIIAVNCIRCFPHLIYYYLHRNKLIIRADTQQWLKIIKKDHKSPFGFVYLLVFYAQFRNIFYFRIGSDNYLLNILCPKMETLSIASCNHIEAGLFLPHGYATTIGANYIGKNCSINNNVTIGTYGDNNRPTILDNVRINSGAVIYGKITIGNNVIIGANTTINTSVPDNSTVFPPTSRIMKWNRLNGSLESKPENYPDN